MIKKFLFTKFIPKIYSAYLKISFKSREFELAENDKCLCLSTRADDAFIGIGATLLKYFKNFNIICLTDSVSNIPATSDFDTKNNIKQNFFNACTLANLDSPTYLSIPELTLSENFSLIQKIDISDYDYIFIPNILEQNVDNKSLAIFLTRLLKFQNIKPNLKIIMYEVWKPFAIVNSFIDISDIIEKKKELLNIFNLQSDNKEYIYSALAIDKYRAYEYQKNYIESFLSLNVKKYNDIVSIIYHNIKL